MWGSHTFVALAPSMRVLFAARFTPEVEERTALLLDHASPAEALVPADRLEDKRREHVEEIFVPNIEAPVDGVHARDRRPAALAVIAVLHDLTHDNIGVVVAFLRALLELGGLVQQTADRRHSEGAEERELQRARRVPREVDPAAQEGDALMIALGVESLDFGENT